MKSLFFKNSETSGKKERVRLNRRVVTFFMCVLIAIFFWLMLSLSKEYAVVISFPVSYQNLPEDKIVSSHLPENIDIEIKSSGFSLLAYEWQENKETIYMDVRDARPLVNRNHYYLLCNSRIDKITSQFENDIKILKISPDTIFLNYNKKVSRLVPVKANLVIECNNEYQQTDPAMIDPAMITVSGDAEMLDKINHVETVPVKLKNVSASVLLKLDIERTPELRHVEFSQSSVQAKVNVAKYTEATLELPVEVENLPAGYSMKTFPDKIIIKCNVAFDEYTKINASQFRAIVDYKKLIEGDNKLKVQLTKFPEGVKAIKLSTEKVEYIIRK